MDISSFREYLVKKRKKNGERLAKSSIERYAEHLSHYQNKIEECKTDEELVACINGIVKRTSSIVVYSALCQYLTFVGKENLWELIPLPAKRAVSASSKRMLQSKVLTRQELSKMLNEAKDLQTRCLFSVLYDTACRATEVVPGEDGEGGIRICDITLVKNEEEKKKGIYAEVRVLGKGRKYRTVYIGKNSLALIRQMLKERKRQPIRKRDLLFGFFKDKDETKPYPNLYAAMYRLIVSECDRILGRHIHPHCLRHTKATHMAEAGANLIDIMAYLGHDDEKTAKIYVEISPSMGKNAFEKYHREISED